MSAMTTAFPRCHPQPRPAGEKNRSAFPDNLIRNLADIRPGDAELVGGKAYPLGLLMQDGFCVPRGFCITAEAFRLASQGEQGEVREIELPELLRERIVSAWRQSGIASAAVRSSATEEDGRRASWAGVFPTELAVENERELLAAVESCFRALYAPEAALYRARGDSGGAAAMAVLVQEMVEAEAAGMVFSCNPISGARDEIVINAVHGLGSALAAGTMTGDTVVVARGGAIKRQAVSAKAFRATSRGLVSVAPGRRELPAVCQQSAAALARIAVNIEALFGCPQDIEFAIAGGCIHILQARPITGLRGGCDEAGAFVKRERHRLERKIRQLRGSGKLRASDVVFSNGNIGELLPTPTPMSFGIFREIFAGRDGAIVAGRRQLGYRMSADAAGGLYELICGQPYFNLEVDAGTFDTGAPMEIDEIVSLVREDPARANYPEFGLYRQSFDSVAEQRGNDACRDASGDPSRDSARRFHRRMAEAGRAMLARFAGEIEPALRRSVAEAHRELDASPSVAQLVRAIGRRVEKLKHGSCVHFVMAARLGFFFAEMVRSRIAHSLSDATVTQHLLQGLEGSRVTDQALDLERVAAGQLPREEFLASYGHLAVNELELSLPRRAELPGAVDGLVNDLIASGRHPGEDFLQQKLRRRSAEAELRQRLAQAKLSEKQAEELYADLRLAQAFLPLRETVKHYYAAEYAVIRALLLRLNHALGWQADDVFYLLPEEIPQCSRGAAKLTRRIARRRRERAMAARLVAEHRLPAVLFASRLSQLGLRHELPSSQRLAGTPVAGGTAIGVVRLHDCAEGGASLQNLRGDEIIVARSANLGLAPVMRLAAGLIVEVGGVLAHAACQARESGIPAVVLPDAMALLRDGMRVRLDGESGVVEILQTQDTEDASRRRPTGCRE